MIRVWVSCSYGLWLEWDGIGWLALKFQIWGSDRWNNVFKGVSQSFEMGLLHPKPSLSLVEKFCQACPHEWKNTRTNRRISDRRNIVTVDEGCEVWLCVLNSCQFFIFSLFYFVFHSPSRFSHLTSCPSVSAFSPLFIRFVCLLCTEIFLELNFLGWFWSFT